MKNLLYSIIILLVLWTIYQYFNPNIEVVTRTTHDTVTVIKTITIKDTVKYVSEKVIVDTVYINNEPFVSYSAPFKIGTDTLNAKGVVAFDTLFTFSDVKFTYPRFVKTITDSIFVTKMLTRPDYTFTTIVGLVAFILGFISTTIL